MTKEELGKTLKSIREEKGVIKQKLVNAGLQHNLINRIEEGSSDYRIDTLLKYCEVVGIQIKLEADK